MPDAITVVSHQAGLPVDLRPAIKKPLAGENATRPQVSVGWVRLQPEDRPELTVLCELLNAPDPATEDSGVTKVPRQNDQALTTWTGSDGSDFDLHLRMDGTDHRTPVDDLYDNLRAMIGKGPKAVALEPLKLIVNTAGVMRADDSFEQFTDTRWLITRLDWSNDPDEILTDDGGHRLIAVCIATITADRSPERLTTAAAKQRRQQASKGAKHNTYTTKRGETLMTVARKKLGDAGRWGEIARLNGLRDPYVPANTHLKLP